MNLFDKAKAHPLPKKKGKKVKNLSVCKGRFKFKSSQRAMNNLIYLSRMTKAPALVNSKIIIQCPICKYYHVYPAKTVLFSAE